MADEAATVNDQTPSRPQPRSHPARGRRAYQRRQRRLALLGLVLPAAAGSVALALVAISQTKVYAYAPSSLPQAGEIQDRKIKLGGIVEAGTLREGPGTQVRFAVTDGERAVPVVFDGFLPSLIAEGDGAVVTGVLREDGVFVAELVAARHDELYMAPEVADALKATGRYDDYVAEKRGAR